MIRDVSVVDKKTAQRTLVRLSNMAAKKARALILGERAAEYGLYTENFSRIAARWDISPTRVALRMADLKIARIDANPLEASDDSFIDAIAYLMLAFALRDMELIVAEKGADV